MKVLLVQSHLGGYESPVFPLGLSYLAAGLRAHHVAVFDPNVASDSDKDFRALLFSFRPDVVGISLRNIDSTNKRRVVFYYKYFREALHIVRTALGPGCRIVVGGPGFSMFAREIMDKEPDIDYGVFLEGEETFPGLLRNLETPEKIKGVFYRRDGGVLFTGPRSFTEPETLPLPDRSVISMSPYVNAVDGIGVETKRGCQFSCAYCVYGFLSGRGYRLISPRQVVDDIETCVKDFELDEFMFIDPVFNVPAPHAEEICMEIMRRGLRVSWSAWFQETALTRSMVRLVREAGCRKVMLSPDALDNRVLRRLGKVQTKEEILKGLETLKREKGDMEICYNFFKNPPGQTLRSALGLVLFSLKGKLQLRNRVHFEFNALRIEPHSALSRMALAGGIIKGDESLLYPRYYSNPDTVYIERGFDLLLRLKEGLSVMRCPPWGMEKQHQS